MEIVSLGQSSFRIKGKSATVVTDPYDGAMLGMKFPKVDGVDIVTISHNHGDHNHVASLGLTVLSGSENNTFVVNGPGEYEVKGVTVVGIATFHDASSGSERGENTVYNLTIDGVRVCHLGDLGHKLTDSQVEEIGNVDILLVPVGGFYTIDAKTAAEVVAQLEPRIVVPMHYKRAGNANKVLDVLTPLLDFLSQMGCEGLAPVPKFTTSLDKLPEATTVVALE